MCVLEKDEQGATRLALEVGTVHGGRPMLLGEADFPIALLERGFDIDVYKGEASMVQDRQRILIKFILNFYLKRGFLVIFVLFHLFYFVCLLS